MPVCISGGAFKCSYLLVFSEVLLTVLVPVYCNSALYAALKMVVMNSFVLLEVELIGEKLGLLAGL